MSTVTESELAAHNAMAAAIRLFEARLADQRRSVVRLIAAIRATPTVRRAHAAAAPTTPVK